MKRIRNILLWCLSLVLCGPIAASPATIAEVAFAGNRTLSAQRLQMMMKSRAGAEYSDEVLREDVKRLGLTDFFSDVSFSTETRDGQVHILVRVKENPTIDSIVFEGNRLIKTEKLKQFLGVREGDIYQPVKTGEGLAEIRKQYQEKGLPFTEVESTTETRDGKFVLTVEVDEVGSVVVETLRFEGATAVPPSRLAKLMKTRQRFMPFRRGAYKPEVLDADLAAIGKFYRDQGFLDVRVDRKITRDRRRLNVLVIVQEGRRYLLGSVTFSGTQVFPEADLRKLLSLTKEGEVFNESKAAADLSALRAYYMDRGYILVEIDARPGPGKTPETINLTYRIAPGQVHSVGEVTIRGNTKTRDKVIRREVRLFPGDTFSGDKVRKSFNNLRDLNYFETINIFPSLSEQPLVTDLVVDVKEKEKTGLFSFGGGYSSMDRAVGFMSLEQRNFDIARFPSFTGGGQNLQLTVKMGSQTKEFTLSFMEPYFLDRPIWFGPDIFSYSKNWPEYDQAMRGGNLRVGRRWEHVSAGVRLTTESVKLSNVEILSLQTEEGTRRKNSFSLQLGYTGLDSTRFPTRGQRASLDTEYAGGPFQGDLDFVKSVFEYNFYRPLGRTVFHNKTMLGAIRELRDTDIPVYEKFFGGGIGTVRGYKERSLGPKDPDTGFALGGQALVAQTVELLYPIYGEIIRGVVFLDMGNIWDKPSDVSRLKKGIGTGIRLAVPLLSAPIQIDYGYALDPEKDERRWQIHYGMTFGF